MTTHNIALRTLEDTQAAAHTLAAALTRGDVVALHGTLGAGKTTFAQFLIAALGCSQPVASPTFTLLQTYWVTLANGEALTLHHYDLYRVEHASELVELGIEDAARDLTIIEWPERLNDASICTWLVRFDLKSNGERHLLMQKLGA